MNRPSRKQLTLQQLIGTNEAESQVDYSTGGRPRVEYRSR